MGNPNVRFIGYDAAEDRKRHRRFVVEPNERLPLVHTFHEVIVFPGLDALYDRTGTRIDITKRNYVPPGLPGSETARLRVARNDEKHCPERMTVPGSLAVLDATLLYLGVYWEHFGHFLMDSMSRLWALDLGLSNEGLLFLENETGDWRKQSYSRMLIEALGVGGRLSRPDTPTLVKSVLAPEPSIQHAFRIHSCHDSSHLKAAQAVLGNSPPDRFRGAKVYLSRRKLRSGVRTLDGEEALENRLARQGFNIVHPEKLSMGEQIALFNQADHIAGSIGSAFHSALFMPKDRDTRLSILAWEKINNRFLMVDSIKSYAATYINCCSASDIDERQRITNMVLDVELATDCILGPSRN